MLAVEWSVLVHIVDYCWRIVVLVVVDGNGEPVWSGLVMKMRRSASIVGVDFCDWVQVADCCVRGDCCDVREVVRLPAFEQFLIRDKESRMLSN
ncbi:unnamed protein product [Anisakis simplex]|uniref:Secreted protein n=1 Tax=Anisakis simplex TaxID=6269 RepID=A0A0M3JPK9_ANISI|nr:unnamed protein product [Anisakis simplex]